MGEVPVKELTGVVRGSADIFGQSTETHKAIQDDCVSGLQLAIWVRTALRRASNKAKTGREKIKLV